ncbi:MAG TPA: insulinase family protein [Candidatus Saccharimonadales bacterium]|nr:insulinase family protein [Candidatus Saccharimonadales bacterium]
MKRVLLWLLLATLTLPALPDAAPAAKGGSRARRAAGAPLPSRQGVLLKGLLPEGLRLLIWYDPELEVETACLAVGVGSQHDMERRQGAAALTAEVVRGGHSGLPAAELAAAWEKDGTSLEVRSDEDAALFLLPQSPGGFRDGLMALGHLVERAEIRPEDVELARDRALRQFQDREPWSEAELALRHELYNQFGYHRVPHGTPATLAEVDRDVCHNYYLQYYRPNNSVLVVTGPVTPEEVRRTATQAFAEWKYGYIPPASPREPAPLEHCSAESFEGIEGLAAVLGAAVVPHLVLDDRLALEVCAEALAPAADTAGAPGGPGAWRRGGLRRHRLCDELRLAWTSTDSEVAGSVERWRAELQELDAGLPPERLARLAETCLDRLLGDEHWTAEAARATLFGWRVDTPDEFLRAAAGLRPERVRDAARRWLALEHWGVVSTLRRSALEAALSRTLAAPAGRSSGAP